MKSPIIATLLVLFNVFLSAQNICNSNGNLIIYSNQQGGNLTIDISENVQNLYIGISSQEPVVVNITGNFASNVKGVIYAGSDTLIDNNCFVNIDSTLITGIDQQLIKYFKKPQLQYINPFGNPQLVGASGQCSDTTFANGLNTVDQIVQYFLQFNEGGELRYHHTQLQCWEGEYKMTVGGNCCILPNSNPEIVAIMDVGSTVICAGNCINFRNFSQGGPFDLIAWSFSGAVPSTSNIFEPVVCYNTPGVYPVSLLVSRNGITSVVSSPAYIQVLEPSNPTVNISYAIPICTTSPAQQPIIPQNFSVGGVFSATNGLIIDPNSGEFDPETTPIGNYAVTYTYPYAQCMDVGSNIFTFNFTIANIPEITTIPSGVVVLCDGSPLVINAESGYSNYQWNNSGNNQQSITITQGGNYFVTANSESGCFATSSVITVLQVVPEPFSIIPTGIVSICEEGAVTVTATSGFANYNWSNGFVGEQQDISQPGVYAVSVFDQNNCFLERSITINQILNPISTYTQSQTFNLTIDFVNNSQNATTFFWNFGDGQFSTDASPSHIYTDNGLFNVSLIASNECGADTFSLTIDVFKLSISSTEKANIRWGQSESFLWFSMPDLNQNKTWKLVSVNGSILNSSLFSSEPGNAVNVPTDFLTSGIYCLVIDTQNGPATIRFVKR
jgi:PKD repeat protein